MASNLPLWEQPGFIPFPDDLNEFTFELACAVLGGNPDGALRDIYFASLASPHTTHSSSKPEDAAHAAKLA